MCNACGFYCCADDGFRGCGCDCYEPLCRDEEDDGGADDDALDCRPRAVFRAEDCGYVGTVESAHG